MEKPKCVWYKVFPELFKLLGKAGLTGYMTCFKSVLRNWKCFVAMAA